MTLRSIRSPYGSVDTNAPVVSVMTLDPICVRADLPLAGACDLLTLHQVRHLPVVEGPGRKLVGIVSATDCRHRAGVTLHRLDCDAERTCGADPCDCAGTVRVRDVMTTDVVALRPDDSLGLAADLFLSRAFHAAPVVEDGDLVGIVTSHDLLRGAYGDILPPRELDAIG